jgi:hypothetical protein
VRSAGVALDSGVAKMMPKKQTYLTTSPLEETFVD